MRRAWFFVLPLLAGALILSCATRKEYSDAYPYPEPKPAAQPRETAWEPAPVSAPADVPRLIPEKPKAAAKRILPVLNQEPIVSVLLDSGSRVEFKLLQEAELRCNGRETHMRRGAVTVDIGRGGMRISPSGVTTAGEAVFAFPKNAPKPCFSLMMQPPFGKPQTLSFAGAAVVKYDQANKQILLMERTGLESYIAGVLPIEMNPSWPVEALRAQAVAARSYAAARYLERFDEPWQLHWHFSVDMAYGGYRPSAPNVEEAMSTTRGNMLMYNKSFPVLALFHASSGGGTESMANLWPNLRAADGRTSFAPVMCAIPDRFCELGAKGLNLSSTHWRWKADVTFADISDGLHGWSKEKPGRPAFGAVTGFRTVDRFTDSGRVANVSIRHKLGKKEIETVMPAHDFRMAAGPGVVRSTWWDRCVVASANGGTLVIEGRGFGHGVGLSQVSAWQMAKQKENAAVILLRFYPGAAIDKNW